MAAAAAGALAGAFPANQGLAVMGANLEIPQTAIADASGVASTTFQAPNVGPRGFQIVTVALTVTGSTPIPKATAYRNLIAPGNVWSIKTAGDRGSFIGEEDVLYMGQYLVIVWTGCTVGASCTAILRGRAVAS